MGRGYEVLDCGRRGRQVPHQGSIRLLFCHHGLGRNGTDEMKDVWGHVQIGLLEDVMLIPTDQIIGQKAQFKIAPQSPEPMGRTMDDLPDIFTPFNQLFDGTPFIIRTYAVVLVSAWYQT